MACSAAPPGARRSGQPDQRVVAVAARQFGKAEAADRPWRPASRIVVRISPAASAVSNRPVKKSSALTRARALVSAGDLKLAAERDNTCGQFGGRVGKGDRTADGAAIANCRMRDVRQCRRNQGRIPRDVGTALGVRVAHQCADFDHVPFWRAILPRVRARPLMSTRRRGAIEPHVERRRSGSARRRGFSPPACIAPRARSHGRANGPWHRQRLPVSRWTLPIAGLSPGLIAPKRRPAARPRACNRRAADFA